MRRLTVERVFRESMVDDATMRRRGFVVLRVGPHWRVLWCKHPQEWRL